MAKLNYKNGITSVILRVAISDVNSPIGDGLAALTFSSSGLVVSTIADNEASATTYTAAGSTIETITTLGTFAAPTATKCRFKEVDATNHKGLYEIQIADARWAVSGARSVIIEVYGATNAARVRAEVQLMVAGDGNAIADSSGRVDLGKWKGTTPNDLTANNNVKSSLMEIISTALTEGATGRIAAAWQACWNVASSTFTALSTNLSAARAGYLDNLNVGGLVASSAEATAIQNNTRVVRVVPDTLERPDSGSTVFRVELLIYDETGNMEAPDSAPTISVVNQGGTSRDSNLDSTTMTLVSTGRYRSTYTIDTNHAIEELIFAFSVIEGGATRVYANGAQVVDTTAVDFTSSDRTTLNDINTKLGTPSSSIAADIAAVAASVWAAGTRTLTSISDSSGVTTLLTKLSGITSLGNWLRALTRKSTPDATALSEINSGGGAFDASLHSMEAQSGLFVKDTVQSGSTTTQIKTTLLAASYIDTYFTTWKIRFLTGVLTGIERVVSYSGHTGSYVYLNCKALPADPTIGDAFVLISANALVVDTGGYGTLGTDALTSIFDKVLETVTIQGTPIDVTVADALRGSLAGALAGLSSGMASGSAEATVQNADGTKDRIVMAIDGEGNRTEVVSMDLS